MGTSTDGQICYGIAFDEDYEFPWDAERDHEIESWWIYRVHGFKHSTELFDSSGNYLNGREPSREEVSKYFAESRAFKDAHPVPVVLINYCSAEYPMYILAAPGTVHVARRGFPAEFNPADLVVSHEARAALLQFCTDHGIPVHEDPKWLLSSYWG